MFNKELMPPIRRVAAGVRALPRLALQWHHIAEMWPRLPFVVAVVVSLVLLGAAVGPGSDLDERVSPVDEIDMSDESVRHTNSYSETPGELEIAEVGFGTVTDSDGGTHVSVGAVLRNPNDKELLPGVLTVNGPGEDGATVKLGELYLDYIPAGSEMPVGAVLEGSAAGVDLDELQLVAEQSFLVDHGGADVGYEWPGPPEIEVVGVEPLFVPEGSRVEFRVTMPADDEPMVDVRVGVIFRDAQGRIVGGMPAVGDPFSPSDWLSNYLLVPSGTSTQFLELPAGLVPDGADLDRIEIGPYK
ncbi:hypothetical protein [Glycomyces buryatensis]|uniref:Uncharacterized protein n=1 Tax=Glycomyces buryatensis TaxID=2570927 RepID=A0A4S8QG21_9ACTN|nr:hypothetical protein [Glycomyces buryatensis]THV43603.1 hypothetical protein FAB82_00670 [Glycomyces buryatensis]